MTFDAFHNGLRILTSIDGDELVEIGITMSNAEWQSFSADPFRFFIKADDDTAAHIWSIIRKRSKVMS